MTGLKRNLINIATVFEIVGSHLSCRTERKNHSMLFAARYWPATTCYQISFNVIKHHHNRIL